MVGAMIGTLVAMSPCFGAMGGVNRDRRYLGYDRSISVQLAGERLQVVHAFALVMKTFLGLFVIQ